jgi:hypothetical protein
MAKERLNYLHPEKNAAERHFKKILILNVVDKLHSNCASKFSIFYIIYFFFYISRAKNNMIYIVTPGGWRYNDRNI